MPNTYFDFKQFRVDQDQSGMKVTTEGCILGAWAEMNNPSRILDIGTGTGLLSLMLAQKYPEAVLEAVEIEPDAAKEALGNFRRSSWSSNLSVCNDSIQNYASSSSEFFDLIVCNPPFFKNSQRSSSEKKARATHNDHLSASELTSSLIYLLKPKGVAFVLYPEVQSQEFEATLRSAGLAVLKELLIRDTKTKPLFRRILQLSKSLHSPVITQNLIIKQDNGSYTDEFVELMAPYYLHL